jgi:type IV secretion system protein VirB10
MSEAVRHGRRVSPLAIYLGLALVSLMFGAWLYGLWHSGVDVQTTAEQPPSRGNSWDADQLRKDAEASPTPAPMALPTIHFMAPPPAQQSTPQPRSPDAMAQWRRDQYMKALEAPVAVAAFEAQHNTKELPSHGTNEAKDTSTGSMLHPPASPYTVMEGSHLAAVLISGINSDIPAPIIAQVELPLYDTATGRYLLIPQGSRLIGKFQQPEGYQDRIQVGWHRLIFPNTASLDLPEMPSVDPKGYGGATDQVNSHYLSTFGTAALMSLLTVGSAVGSIGAFNNGQVSPYTGAYYQPNPQQQLEQQALQNGANSMAQTGSMFLQNGMNRPKTITIRPGYRLDVFLTQDLVLPGPYKD